MEKTKHKRSASFWLCIALVLCLISCIGASLLQTDFGNVQIINLRFQPTMANGFPAICSVRYLPQPKTRYLLLLQAMVI